MQIKSELLDSIVFPVQVLIPSLPPDTGLQAPVPQPQNNPLETPSYSPFHLNTPPSLSTSIEYNPVTNSYDFQNMIGNTPYGPSSTMNINEFIDYDLQQEIKKYWRDKGASYSGVANRRGGGGLIPQIKIGGDVFESIFGSNVIDIRPAGNVEVTFGLLHNRDKNPNLSELSQRRTDFNFDEKIELSLIANIGDKISFNLNYNTESNFEFDNKMKLQYQGKEDDILQLLEFGNVSMPLSTTLISGSQTLFGLKTALQFGKLTVTAVASEQSSETQTTVISGGAQTQDFYIKADGYEDNKHFFIAQYFRDHYNEYLSTLPLVGSPIVITKIEVWRTTVGAATTENRNIVAFTDLAEYNPQSSRFDPYQNGYPSEYSNTLLSVVDSSLYRDIANVSNNLRSLGLTSGEDYEKIESARLLSSSEYSFNSKLGFISLNTALTSDQVLAVAFQYQVIGDNTIYQVGEFSTDVVSPKCLRVKLLKSTSLDTKSSLWKLMMKNVYNLQAYGISSDKFRLNILYTGDEEGVANGFFNLGSQKGIPLIRLMGLDNLNQQQDPSPDGIFDFIDNADVSGGTIVAQRGRIYFPTIEPFGNDLRAVLTEPEIANKYCFDSLYTMTQEMAQQYTNKNKYYIEGTYTSTSGSEFMISGASNLSEGSVTVTAGGIPLTENVDYTVNYTMGTITIINEGVLQSGTPITVTAENNDDYSFNKKRMFGVDLAYEVNRNFRFGGTLLNLSEIPQTSKVNYGNEPINNTIWGMNLSYKHEVPFVTKIMDFLPFYSTTATSNFQFDAEFAHFIPGHSRLIGKEGTTYIDDFESAKSTIDLKSFTNWVLASTPQGQANNFREALTVSNTDSDRRKLAYGYNRAKLAWYIIDQLFYYTNNSSTPNNLTDEDKSRPYARAVYETELFPNKEYQSTQSTYMSVFNLAFYPTIRGPYNYDVTGSEGYSAGVNVDGTLKAPETRWGGIMRKFDNTDFESYNYEYIEFWMMDPFIENPAHTGGKLYFNLGDISEDILRDGVKFFENGLPTDGSDENVEFTVWGRVPTIQQIVSAFESSDESARPYQDVGYDGLQDAREVTFFQENYLSLLANEFGTDSPIYQNAISDPSSDNFHHFRGTDYDEQDLKIIERYLNYNNSEGNTPVQSSTGESYLTIGSSVPNVEDVNNDNTLSEDEKYYQYVINLSPEHMIVGENYITDIYEATPERLPDGTTPLTKWYQFRIPIKNPDQIIGNISGFNSIRFLRIFMRDFSEPIICRLATFELVRSDWRTCTESLLEDGDYLPSNGNTETQFNIATVSYEENANRIPIPYVLPPGLERERNASGLNVIQEDEQSLTMKVVDLMDGDARAIYKSTGYDMRQFKRLEMFIHAEDVFSSGDLTKGDITVFMRIGSDFTENYYEYEIPVEITPWGVGKDTAAIWPSANKLSIYLDSLVDIKQARNIAVRNGTHPSNLEPYEFTYDNGNKITIMGMPNLSDVSTILIGVRNPKKQYLNDGDDMMPKSVLVWVNELSLNGFDDRSGVAALARMRLNLADLGDLTFSTTFSTPGYGSLEQTITERTQATNYTVDIATNLDGGKILFPEKWKVKIPFHYDYSLTGENPLYNPLNPDVELKEDLKTYSLGDRDSIRAMTTTVVQRQNVNLTNVRKERNLDKPLKIRPWDIENLDFSYSYSEVKQHDVDVEFDNAYTHQGQIGYSYTNNPKNIRPFSKVKWMKSKWLALIRDFNFTPLPKNFTFRTTLLREFNEFKYRPKSQGNIIIDTSYVKNFGWTRNYALQWDLAQSLKFEYRADVTARLDEPEGRIDNRTEKDSIWRSFGKGGRMTYFTQRVDLSWTVPLSKIPILNWLSANVRYNGTYNFTSSALSLQYLGNTIENSNTLQGNGSVNLLSLYNKVPYLKRVNQGSKGKNAKKDEGNKSKNKLGKEENEDENDQSSRKNGKSNKNKKDGKDSTNVKEGPSVGKIILDGTVRFFMMARNFSVSYSEGAGTLLPGYMSSPNLFGIDFSNASPGFLFAFGGQPNILEHAAEGGWLTTDSLMTTAFSQRKNQNLNYRATIEPFKDFRIDVTGSRVFTKNFTQYYRYSETNGISYFSPLSTGNFTISYVGLKTFFNKSDDVFEYFKTVRHLLSEKISNENPNSGGVEDAETGYYYGYSGVSQEVLTAAFLAAYAGKDPEKMDVLNPFTSIPLPNWRLNYNGFSKIKGVNKVFQNLTLSHTYTCTYSIGGYTSNLLFESDINGNPSALNSVGNFIHSNEYSQITISEQFSPLIGFDMTLKNSLTLKIEYKKARNISMSFSNNQITEVTSNEIAVAAGYRFKDLKIGMVFSGMKRQVVSDLNLTLGFSIKDNMTVLRKIEEEQTQVSAGTMDIAINVQADYQVSKMVGLRFYYTQSINRPYISLQYDSMNIDTGITVRLMLTQ